MQLGSFHFDESFAYVLQRDVQEKKKQNNLLKSTWTGHFKTRRRR